MSTGNKRTEEGTGMEVGMVQVLNQPHKRQVPHDMMS